MHEEKLMLYSQSSILFEMGQICNNLLSLSAQTFPSHDKGNELDRVANSIDELAILRGRLLV